MLTIGQLSERTAVPTHVLRHWEDCGVLVPARAPSGHRRYDDDAPSRVMVVRRLQAVGFGLADIAVLRSATRTERVSLVERHVAELERRRREVEDAADFLRHTLECTHPVMVECAECGRYAAPRGPVGASPRRPGGG